MVYQPQQQKNNWRNSFCTFPFHLLIPSVSGQHLTPRGAVPSRQTDHSVFIKCLLVFIGRLCLTHLSLFETGNDFHGFGISSTHNTRFSPGGESRKWYEIYWICAPLTIKHYFLSKKKRQFGIAMEMGIRETVLPSKWMQDVNKAQAFWPSSENQ